MQLLLPRLGCEACCPKEGKIEHWNKEAVDRFYGSRQGCSLSIPSTYWPDDILNRILHSGFGIILLEIISFNTLILPMRKLRPREVNSIPRKVIGRTNTRPQCSTWDPTFWTIFFVTWGNVQVFTHIHVLFLIHFYDQGNRLLWKNLYFIIAGCFS